MAFLSKLMAFLSKQQELFHRLFLKRKYLHADYVAVFSSAEGQRVLKDICEMGYISRCTFNPNVPEKTTLNEGSRLLALAILNKLNKQPIEAVTESIIGD